MQGYDNPVVRGIMTGLAIRQSLENSARQKTMLEDAQRKMDLEDIQNRMMLEQVSRPITNGAVSESLPVPGGITPGLDVSGISFDVARKPDASRTVKYKTRGGETITRELMTPDEQLQKKIRDAAQMDEARTQSQISAEQLMRERMGVRLPGFENIPLLPKEASTVMDNMVRESAVNARSAADRASRESMAEEARKSRESIAEGNRKAADKRAAENNASRERAARTRADNPPKPKDPTEALRAYRNELGKLEEKENALHLSRQNLGQMLSSGKIVDDKGAERDLDQNTRSKAQNKLKMDTASVNSVMRQKFELMRQHGVPFGPPPEVGASLPAGKEVEFANGQVWKKKADGTFEFVRVK